MKLRINIQGNEYELDATRQGETLVVELNGVRHQLTVLESSNGALTLDLNGKRLRVAGVKSGQKRQVVLNGRAANYERVTEGASGADSAEGSLSASIPAVVAEVLVSVGDTVTAGEKLILLESMKMIIPIQATTDGEVVALHCAAGDSVQAGVPLIEITPT